MGASEVALALACAAADRGRRVVLVDADDAGPSLAQRLGVSPYPNLRSAVDAVEHRAGDLTRALVPVRRGALLLPGLASSQDWMHLRPAEVLAVVARLRLLADVVITDVGDGIEDLSGWGGPARHGVGRALIVRDLQTLAVGYGSVVGDVSALLARPWPWAIYRVAGWGAVAPGSLRTRDFYRWTLRVEHLTMLDTVILPARWATAERERALAAMPGVRSVHVVEDTRRLRGGVRGAVTTSARWSPACSTMMGSTDRALRNRRRFLD